ncbi:hypothetical protein M422DRAFT_43566 [Sphaerobolus stellatus SS14]|nr:hypothetical protein M422DRAFT_43566 [Sphaerobolus stellatus SS14]
MYISWNRPITGHITNENLTPPKMLCFVEAVLLDGVVPMNINNGSVRERLRGLTSPVAKRRWLKLLLLISPYITALTWWGTSLGLGLKWGISPKTTITCFNNVKGSNRIRRQIGFFIAGFSIIDLFLEGWIIFMIIRRSRSTQLRMNLLDRDRSLLIRLGLLTIIQLCAVMLGATLSGARVHDQGELRFIESLVVKLDPFVTFLVFGSSRSITNIKVIADSLSSMVWYSSRGQGGVPHKLRFFRASFK